MGDGVKKKHRPTRSVVARSAGGGGGGVHHNGSWSSCSPLSSELVSLDVGFDESDRAGPWPSDPDDEPLRDPRDPLEPFGLPRRSLVPFFTS